MHARALIFSAFTAIGLVALASSLPSHAQGAMKPSETLVVNPTSRPVPVTVLSTPAQPGEGSREIYRLASTVFIRQGIGCSAPQTVPAGKRLVLQHVSGHALLSAPHALSWVGIGSQAGPNIDVLVPAGPPQSDGSTTLSVAGQQVHVYLDDQFEVCAQSFGQLPFSSVVAVRLNGYLVNKP
jgi:hypothetical protein